MKTVSQQQLPVLNATSYTSLQIFLFRLLKWFILSWMTSLELLISLFVACVLYVICGLSLYFTIPVSGILYYYLIQPPSLPPGQFGPEKSNSYTPSSPAAPLRGSLVSTSGPYFKESGTNRTYILRGLNLGGGCKLPTLPSPHFLYDSKTSKLSLNISFVGRPIPLSSLSSHLRRIRAYGFTVLRLLVTWEAVEPTSPGQYDEKFLKYFRQVVIECHRQNISVFVDPHQDVWSRFTGGSGAPSWTLETVGFDVSLLDETGSSLTPEKFPETTSAKMYGHKTHPKMVWGMCCSLTLTSSLLPTYTHTHIHTQVQTTTDSLLQPCLHYSLREIDLHRDFHVLKEI